MIGVILNKEEPCYMHTVRVCPKERHYENKGANMTDYKKLCEELRDDKFKYDEGYPSYSSFKTTRDCADAVEAIEELQSASEEKDKRIAELQVENERLKKQLMAAVECIGECEEAFSNRCHDDYAEEAVEKWNRRADNG